MNIKPDFWCICPKLMRWCNINIYMRLSSRVYITATFTNPST